MEPTGTSRESEPHKDSWESSTSFSLAQILHLQDGDVLQEKPIPLSHRRKVMTMVLITYPPIGFACKVFKDALIHHIYSTTFLITHYC